MKNATPYRIMCCLPRYSMVRSDCPGTSFSILVLLARMPTDRQTGTHGVDTAAKRRRLDQMPNDVVDADHANQCVVLKNRQQPYLVLVHQLQDRVDRIVSYATDKRPV